MKKQTFEYIISLIKNHMNEEVVGPVPPTNSVSSGKIEGLTKDPPVDLRKKRYKKLPDPYKDLFRRKRNV